MSLIRRLEEVLEMLGKGIADLPGIKGWRVVVDESHTLSLGIKENVAGSVYTPPSFRRSEHGEAFIVWEDGRISKATVQYPFNDTPDYWLERFREWRQAAYVDSYDTEIHGVRPLPAVELEDPCLYRLVMGEERELFAQVQRLLTEKPPEAMLNGGVQASWGYRHVRTSTGIDVSYAKTGYGLSYSIDSLVSAGFSKRRLIAADEWDYLWQRTLGYYQALGREAPEPTAESVVIFSPAVTAAMLDQFIVPNFSGQRILNGQSAFRQSDFAERTQRFADGLTLTIDPLRALEIGSYPLTSEGVPAQRTELVKNGCLVSPYLRLKEAKQWGISPTALPSGTANVYVIAARREEWHETVTGIEDGVLVLSVLGLHTQDALSGDYSLSAPRSLRIIDGKIAGRVDVKLSGNFFRDLASETTRYAYTDYDNKPYLVLRAGVSAL